MAELETVNAKVQADTRGFRTGIRRAQRSLNDFSSKGRAAVARMGASLDKLRRSVFNVRNGLIATAGATALGFFIQRQIAATDAIGKAADTIGISVEALQELRFVADLTGVSQQNLERALRAMVRRQGEAINGNKQFAEGFERLGIAVEELRNLSADELFQRIAEGAQEFNSQAEQVSALDRVFSEVGRKLVNVFGQGPEAIREMRQEAQELGLVLGEDMVRSAEAANDQLSILGQVLGTQLRRLAVSLAPQILRLGEAFQAVTPQIIEFFNAFVPDRFLPADALQDRIDELVAQREELQKRINRANERDRTRARLSDEEAARRIKGRATALGKLNEGIAKFQGLLEDRQKQDETFKAILDGTADSAGDASVSIASLRKELEFELAQLGRNEAQQRLYNIAKESGIEDTQALREELGPLIRRIQNERAAIEARTRAEQEAERAEADLDRRTQTLIESTRTAREEYRATKNELAGLREQLEAAGKLTPEVARALRRAADEAKRTFEDTKEDVEQTDDVMRELGATFESSFERAIANGESFRSVLRGIEQDLLRLFLRSQVTGPLSTALFGGDGGGLFGALGRSIGSAFGGPTIARGGPFGANLPTRAAGGPVSPGRAFLVGERGPEVFQPSSSGRITPNNQLASAGRIAAPQTSVRVHVAPGTRVTEERQNTGGGQRIDLFIDQAVGDLVRRPGTKTNRALRDNFNLQGRVIQR